MFKTEFQVRGYELDGYGHVNHAVYLNYAEFARWRMIEDSGAGGDYFKRHAIAPVIVRAEADYREPCFLADWIVVETTLVEFKKRLARFSQIVKKRESGRVAAELLMTVLVVDAAGKVVSLPDDFERYFT